MPRRPCAWRILSRTCPEVPRPGTFCPAISCTLARSPTGSYVHRLLHRWAGTTHGASEAWLRCPWAVAGPGRASRSTTPSRQARVWRSRGQATAHRCHPRAHQAARPHSRIQQHLEHQLHPEHQRPTTTTHRHRPQMPPTGASSSPAPQACATRHAPRNAPPGTRPETRPEHQRPHKHTPEATESGPEPLGSGPPSILSDYRRCAPGGTTRQVLTGARQQSAVSSARPPCHPCRSSRR